MCLVYDKSPRITTAILRMIETDRETTGRETMRAPLGKLHKRLKIIHVLPVASVAKCFTLLLRYIDSFGLK